MAVCATAINRHSGIKQIPLSGKLSKMLSSHTYIFIMADRKAWVERLAKKATLLRGRIIIDFLGY